MPIRRARPLPLVTLSLVTLVAFALVGCDDGGGDDAGPPESDAGPPAEVDAGPPADVDAGPGLDDAGPGPAHCGGDVLRIAAVDPGNTITIFNPTASAIDLTGSEWVICHRPNYATLDTIESDVMIPAGGSHDFPYPSGFPATDAGGELALYTRSAFTNAEALIDFVCWGTGSSAQSRLMTAEADGDWSGPCAGAITGDALTRIPDTDGVDAASYDPTGTSAALSCP